MRLYKNILSFILLVVIITSDVACGQIKEHELNKDQEKILSLYASKNLLKEGQYLYYKSEDSLSPFLELPLTAKDFKLPKFSTLPGDSQQYLDTLFSEQELQSWSKQIANYRPIRCNQHLFSDSVTVIREEQIPKYLNRTDIPPPGQDPIFIHYISIPFMYENKSALMYSRQWSSGANVKVYYLYFVKKNGLWQLKDKGLLAPIY